MQKSQMQVRSFHQVFRLVINDNPTVADEKTLKLRCKLLLEEVIEFCNAAGFTVNIDIEDSDVILMKNGEPNLIEMADALTDIQYVNDGAAVSLGIDLSLLSDEVHRSNMSKLWTAEEVDTIDPKLKYTIEEIYSEHVDKRFLVKNQLGKGIKSPSYSPANIRQVLIDQGAIL